MMTEITLNQFNLVVNMFSFTMGAMGIAAVFFILKKSDVLPRYRTGVTLLGLVSLVATYNYYRLLSGWHESYAVVGNAVRLTGIPYDDTYRYADWLLTVPLLLVGLVMVLDLPARQARVRGFILGLLAAEMIGLGYPGQVSNDLETRLLWWGVSMVPFLIIVYQLYFGLSDAVEAEPPVSRKLVKVARLVTVLTWSFYPAVYLLPTFGVAGSDVFIATQIGYAAADMVAKAVYGVVLCMIAASKSEPAAVGLEEHRTAAVRA